MSKAKKAKKTLVEQILDKSKIDYTSWQINALTGQLPDHIDRTTIYKTLAMKGDKTGVLIGLVPITAHLSEKKLAKISGNKKVVMLPQKDLQRTTGYVHGANNPVGIHQKHAFPIFIDQTALDHQQILVSAGEIGRSIGIEAKTLADFVGARFADLIEENK